MIESDGGRWTEARWLKIGDHFLTRTGKSATVTGLTIRTERVRVYNLEVVEYHLYAITAAGILVHNACPAKAIYPDGFRGGNVKGWHPAARASDGKVYADYHHGAAVEASGNKNAETGWVELDDEGYIKQFCEKPEF